jgi:hypothetical protein
MNAVEAAVERYNCLALAIQMSERWGWKLLFKHPLDGTFYVTVPVCWRKPARDIKEVLEQDRALGQAISEAMREHESKFVTKGGEQR